ncbi:MAG: glycoside hydrolase family 2 protein [Bacteroidaceae bacterium]|nr:glycoside hydrolase family 2 protein [Bacteroidaceae bacterium]
MSRAFFVLIFLFAPFMGLGGCADAQRDSILFNFDWQFSRDKQTWTAVNLPHDYQIGQPWVAPAADEKADLKNEAANIKSLLSARAFKALGKGYYRKAFVPKNEWQGRRVVVDFEGMLLVGDAYLNGRHIGKTDYGYLGFESDITPLLKWGEENTLEVVCDTQNPNSSRWYTGGGLFRDVHVIITDRNFYFTRNPLYITTKVEGQSATVHVQAEFANQYKGDKERIDSLTFAYTIKDGSGKVVAQKVCRKKYYGRQRVNEYRLDSVRIDNAVLWDIDNPHLYTIEICALGTGGEVLDKVGDTFGVRTIEYGADYGFRLNGRKVLLKGIANHHTLGALGAAAYDRAIEKRIQLLKEFGVNHIRTSHNPYSKGFLHLCDKYGILVVDELYDKWLKQFSGGRVEWTAQWQHDLPEFIKRDRNHPSVVMWSLGNELQQEWGMAYADWGVTIYRSMKPVLQRYDNTRPITVAMHPRFRDVDTDSIPAPLALETDIASYNYRYMYFPGDAKRYPWMRFYQSEANTQGLGKNFFEMNLDKVVGLAYWGAIDYLGESQGWPRKGWNLGFFDISLLPKPTAYFVKSYFTEEPMVHLSVYQGREQMDWNGVNLGNVNLTEQWDAGKGAKQTLYAFSNADEVELRINGKTKARLKNKRNEPTARNKFIFTNVDYEKGKAQAIAYTGGRQVATYTLETTGAAKRLKMETDNAKWKADGIDLQHIRITAVDAKGRRVYGTNGILKIKVDGDATIVAASNGDQTCEYINTPTTADRKQMEYPLYDGAAMVILRSERKGGMVKDVKLTVNETTKHL